MTEKFFISIILLILFTNCEFSDDKTNIRDQELLLASLSKALLNIPKIEASEPEPEIVHKSSSMNSLPFLTEETRPKKSFMSDGAPVPSTPLLEATPSVQHPSISPNEILLDKVHILDSTAMTFTLENNLPEDSIHIIKVSGAGIIIIELFKAEYSFTPVYSHAVIIDNFLKPSLIPISANFLSGKGDMIKLSIGPSQMIATQFKFIISLAKTITIKFNENFKIHTTFTNMVHCQITNPTLQANLILSNRLQFILQTSFETQPIYGGEEVEMYINSAPKFPSKSDYQLKASGSLGTGLIKTLSPGKEHYCFKEDCIYYVTIYTTGVDYINFFPTVFANGSILQFHQFLFLVEEIEPNEKIEYVLQVPKIDGSWVFSVIPTMGSVELFINPDFKPDDYGKYKYMIHSAQAEEIIVTAQEANEFGFSHEKFFITYKTYNDDIPATFRFEVKRYNVGEKIFIKENYAEGGVAAKNEIINYYLNLGSDIPQSLNAVFKMDSYFGHADLYIKECLLNELECAITNEDIDLNEKRIANQERIFRTSNNGIGGESQLSKTNFITLNFNCLKSYPGYTFTNHYPISKSCLFAVGVHCKTSFNKNGANYKLVAYGQGAMSSLKLGNSTILKLSQNENARYRIDVSRANKLPNITSLNIKIIAINGIAKVYFSKTNEMPDEADHESALDIQDENLVSLRTIAYETQVNLAGPFKEAEEGVGRRFVYMSILSRDYSVLDIYPELSGQESPRGIEAIKEANIIHRKITGENFFVDPKTQSNVYYSNFLFQIPEKSQYNYYLAPKLNFSVNSQITGMRICIQENRAEFNWEVPCQFQSTTDYLTIDDKLTQMDKGKKFVISIQKAVTKDQPFDKFPIDFTLSLNTGTNIKEQELHIPGKTFSSVLNSGEGIQLKIDLRSMRKKAQIYFYTSDPSCQATISIGEGIEYNYLASLDHSLIGLNIKDSNDFKAKYCKKDCPLKIGIYSFGNQGSRFTVLYVIDDIPVVLKEGDQVIVANNIETYFVYEIDDASSVSFSAHSDHTLSVIYSKALPERNIYGTKQIFTELTDMNFDFKTNIEAAPMIVYPKEILEKMPNKILGFFVQPKLHFRYPISGTIDIINITDALNVYLHSKSLRLLPFMLTDGNARNGEFLYYQITIDHPEDFSVILSLHSGEATMYMSKGDEDFPTEKRYWKKTSGSKGDEITVTKDSFEIEKEIVGNYIIGVRGNEQTHFSLLFMPEFKNLIKMRFQRLVDMTLLKEKNYYFDLYITQKSYNTLLFAENSDLEISVLKYDDNKYQDFLSMVTSEENYFQKFTFKKGDLPRDKFYENVVEIGTHIIVRAKATQADARINFVIYDSQRPILVPSEKRFTFVQKKDDKAVFLVKLDSKYDEVDLDVKLDFGSISVSYSDLPNSFNNLQRISVPSQKYFQFRVEKSQKSNDILIFNEFYIHIAADEFSKFSLLVKPKDKFKQLKAFEPEIIYTDPDKDIYVHYHMSIQQAKTLLSLVIDFNSVHYYSQRPELLFISESDTVIDENSPFLPMPLKDLTSRDNGEFRHLEIKPDIQPGYFILKIEKFPKKLPIKINISLNNQKNIEINGLYQGSIPLKQDSSLLYSMFIPQAGEFRIVLESCSGVKIEGAEFSSSHPLVSSTQNEDNNIYQYNSDQHSTSIKFEDDFVQGYSFLFLNETQSSEAIDLRMLEYPVKRGFVTEKGILSFRVIKDEETTSLSATNYQEEFYTLLSEYRPMNKELILKDYVKFFDPNQKSQQRLFTYQFKEGTSRLWISALMPVFHQQLLVDYPLMKVAKLKLFFYLLAEPDIIVKLEHCGQSMLKTVTHDLKTIEREFTRDQLKAFNQPFEFLRIEFSNEEIAKYSGIPHLNVLSYISVNFYENEEDEFNINLNLKYTNVPYFLLTIPNRHGALLSVTTGMTLIVIILIVFFIIFYTKAKKDKDEGMRKDYKKANDNSSSQETTRLEMSTISRDESNQA